MVDIIINCILTLDRPELTYKITLQVMYAAGARVHWSDNVRRRVRIFVNLVFKLAHICLLGLQSFSY